MNAREFYIAITNTEVSDELKAYAATQLDKMDASNARVRAKTAEKKLGRADDVKRVIATLTSEPRTATAIVEALAAEGITEFGEKPITRQKIATMLRDAIDEGLVVKTQVKGDNGKVMAYSLPTIA